VESRSCCGSAHARLASSPGLHSENGRSLS
jgi:hypothetical protein